MVPWPDRNASGQELRNFGGGAGPDNGGIDVYLVQ